ncbi:hypothetical protein ACFLW8_02010 [Chloroflexota bacterium]
MSKGLTNERIKEMLQSPPEEMYSILPIILDQICKRDIGEIIENIPFLLPRLTEILEEIDTAKLLNESPETPNNFTNVLWKGVAVLAPRFDELNSLLKRTRDINVNIDASDSLMKCHFIIGQGAISGGSGLLHFSEQDFRFLGPTKILIALLRGELALGFSNVRLQTEGIPEFTRILAPVIRGIAKLIRGE